MSITILLIISQIATNYFTGNTDKQPYKLIKKDGKYEIRYYPPIIMATVKSNQKSFDSGSSANFRRLAGYIFGGNQSDEQISMTSPVHMDKNENGSTMSFIMPEGYTLENLPKPKESGIMLHESKAEYTASIRYGGFSNDKDFEKHKAELISYLKINGIKHENNFRFLGYDAPYQLINRRNEVIVRIELEGKE